jgi:hypothetical protein
MWVALLLAGWLITSLLMGPWIGRFVSAQEKLRQDRLPSKPLSGESDSAKPVPMVRRA